jgi:acetolactate synthase small subunit
MQAFHIHYRNTQGTLMRIMNAASRRGIDMPYVHAVPSGYAYTLTLLLDVNPKQTGQLCRDWRAIVDVVNVRAGAAETETAGRSQWFAPHPPASVNAPPAAARSAMA